MILSASLCHFQQCPLEIGTAQEEWVGWGVHPKSANSVAMSGLYGRKALVGTRWPISVFLA